MAEKVHVQTPKEEILDVLGLELAALDALKVAVSQNARDLTIHVAALEAATDRLDLLAKKMNTNKLSAVSSPLKIHALRDVFFSYQIVANEYPLYYALTPSPDKDEPAPTLPVGLVLDPETGILSGIPRLADTFEIPVTVVNSLGPTKVKLSLVVAAPKGEPLPKKSSEQCD